MKPSILHCLFRPPALCASPPAFRPPGFSLLPAKPARCAGLSLIEIMVAVMLLTLIMLGLFSAFYQTQRAFRLSASQTDVLEGSRATIGLLSRELQELTASRQVDGVNLLVMTSKTIPNTINKLPLLGGEFLTNRLSTLFFLTRTGDTWTGVGYFTVELGQGVGTLYRFTMTNDLNRRDFRLGSLLDAYGAVTYESNTVGRVAEGIVHLSLRAFNTNGIEYIPGGAPFTNNIAVWDDVPSAGLAFTNQMLPAFLELELGMVDPQVYRQYKAINDANSAAAAIFLQNQAGKVYLFRQRIPIRSSQS
jgi:hypothetical protein